jgi:beta-N-acetylhexosaminidase
VEYENIDPYPASLSEKLYDILRNKIGFNGVIITDSMDMKAISLNYSYREIVNLSLNNGADIVESADTGTAENLKYELEKIEIKDENNKIKRIKNLIPERILNFKPPDKIMDVISYRSIVWKRYVTLEPEKDFYLIFMPYSLTNVNSDMNNYSKLKDELELNNFKFKFVQFSDLNDMSFTGTQLVFLGRNENFYDNYKIINEKAKGNRCVYISTSLGMDDGLINDDIGYICTYSTKVENIIYAIYSILGFV